MKKIDTESGIQFVKFAIVGVSNTFVSLLFYYFLLYLGINYVIANIGAFLISVLNSFYWNKKYVFKCKDILWGRSLFKTYISYGFSFILGIALLIFLVEYLSLSEKLAPLFVLFITVPLNFLMNKLWAFN